MPAPDASDGLYKWGLNPSPLSGRTQARPCVFHAQILRHLTTVSPAAKPITTANSSCIPWASSRSPPSTTAAPTLSSSPTVPNQTPFNKSASSSDQRPLQPPPPLPRASPHSKLPHDTKHKPCDGLHPSPEVGEELLQPSANQTQTLALINRQIPITSASIRRIDDDRRRSGLLCFVSVHQEAMPPSPFAGIRSMCRNPQPGHAADPVLLRARPSCIATLQRPDGRRRRALRLFSPATPIDGHAMTGGAGFALSVGAG